MDWLFQSEFDTAVTVALWSIVAVTVTAIILFAYTIALRIVALTRTRRRQRFLMSWRNIFILSILSRKDAAEQTLPVLHRGDHTDLLEEWNRARSIVSGSAVDNLIELARRTRIPDLAFRLLKKRGIRPRILAVQTFGHLRDSTHRGEIRQLVEHDNTALSITAAEALVEIDPGYGASVVVPLIEQRRDWPANRVSILLNLAGSERVSEPLYRAIRSAENDGRMYLLKFARLMEPEVLDALLKDLMSSSNDPGVLSASLKLISGYGDVPRLKWLTQHETWFVRIQAAKVIGRVGQEEHLPLLESMLSDSEWWVRYRAAQSIVSLPFLGPNQLRKLQKQQSDRYAVDILQQAFAEVGLA